MQRWNDLRAVPEGYGPSIVTIGNFDGVHRGHQAVLGRVVAQARRECARAVAITFDPHPLAVLRPELAPQPLCSAAQRLELLAEQGLDGVLVMPFTLELAAWSPERFVETVLVKALGSRTVVVGHDMRFGHRNSGDVDTLRELGVEYGYEVDVVADLGASDDAHPRGRRWSSTWIRELLAAGEVATAAQALGRPHRMEAVVVHGDHRGRELGFPTANLAPDVAGMVPADGVYAGWLVRGGADGRDAVRLPAAISIGTNPTFAGADRRVEAYALDRDDLDLYGEQVGVDLLARLRPTLRFDSVAELVTRMHQDVEAARALVGTGPTPLPEHVPPPLPAPRPGPGQRGYVA